MKKKGFTLIEIIVCIALISIIGVSSFFGIKYIKNKSVTKELSQITNKAFLAADVYIETNKEANNKLYDKKNAVFIPLTELINEGLLSLDSTSLTKNQVKGHYVIKSFSPPSGSNKTCDSIETVASWDKDATLYICTINSTTNVNNYYVNDNNNIVSAERVYLTDYTKNYAKFKDKTYRILYKDIDNSLILYTDDDNGFGNDFDNITQSFPQNDPKALQCDSLSNCNTIKATSPLSATNLVFYDKNGKTTSYNDEPYLYTGFSYNFDRPTDCTGKINNDEMGILWGKTNVKGEYNLYKPNISYDLSKLILLKYGYKDLSSGYIDSYRYAKLIFRKKLDVVNKEQYMTFDIISKLNEVEYPDFIKYQEVLSINAYYFSSLKIGGTTYDKAGVYSCEGGQNNNAKSGNVMIKGRKINLKPCVIIESGTGGENNPFILSSNSC